MNELALQTEFTQALALDGIAFKPNALEINRELESDELKRMILFVSTATDACLYWTGDLLLHIKNSRGEDAAREAAKQFDDPQAAWDAFKLSEDLPERVSSLTYRHHKAAIDECRGHRSIALQWLQRASMEGWTVSKLRTAIRESLSDSNVPESSSGSATVYADIRRLNIRLGKVLDAKPVDTWTEGECDAFLNDVEPILEKVQDVTDRWKYFNPELQAVATE
jgi:hypothetical protein